MNVGQLFMNIAGVGNIFFTQQLIGEEVRRYGANFFTEVRNMKKQKLHERMQSKFHNFKNEQKQKYDLSKRYFASDEEMNEEEFAAKEKLFFLVHAEISCIFVYFCGPLFLVF